LRALGTEELRQRLIQTKEDLFHLKLRQRTTKLENPMKLAQTRREISRVLTLLCEREIEERRRSRG
jgi:large subunit ribosomal protein L29